MTFDRNKEIWIFLSHSRRPKDEQFLSHVRELKQQLWNN